MTSKSVNDVLNRSSTTNLLRMNAVNFGRIYYRWDTLGVFPARDFNSQKLEGGFLSASSHELCRNHADSILRMEFSTSPPQ
jgi:hypothetical protein